MVAPVPVFFDQMTDDKSGLLPFGTEAGDTLLDGNESTFQKEAQASQ